MLLALLAIVGGFALLLWSADHFVEGAAATAKHAGMPLLLIGMIIVGFGTSAPEMVVSALAALDGNPGLALGNAYGSNIANIALVLGLTALISPLLVNSSLVRKELPILVGLTVLAGGLLLDGELGRLDAVVLMILFFGLMGWSVYSAVRGKGDPMEADVDQELIDNAMPLKTALFWLVVGLVVLVISSRILVWGAVTIAQQLGVSELIIGLTIVALGTSLPELAATVAAARKGEHDIALGNIVGSCMFNLLMVVGIAGAISPMSVMPEVLHRDWTLMFALTAGLLVMGYGIRGRGQINRIEGGVLLAIYIAYNAYLALHILGG